MSSCYGDVESASGGGERTASPALIWGTYIKYTSYKFLGANVFNLPRSSGEGSVIVLGVRKSTSVWID